MNAHRPNIPPLIATILCCLALFSMGCASDPTEDLATAAAATSVPTTAPIEEPVQAPADEPVEEPTEVADEPATPATPEPDEGAAAADATEETETPEGPEEPEEAAIPDSAAEPEPAAETEATDAPAASLGNGCEATASLFVTRGSANPDLEDPFVQATCAGDTISILTNAVPDYTYIGTSPGVPGGREATYTIPATPTLAAETTDIPYIGTAAITLSGIPIFGPTEGTGGDVDSLPGIISVCGSHNGPSGFHIHKIGTSTETDCLFTPAEVAAAPQLVGYALDGFPIYTGADQYTSSWQLTDESLFASDTWAAHSYVEGSGDLDRCNGRTDAAGNYAYFTTDEFPYVLGCFVGEVEIGAAGGGGAGGDDRPERPEGDAGAEGEDRPERPEPAEGEEAAAPGDRPERPERPEGEGGERPERPEPPAGDDG